MLHTISVLVENHFGVLARISGLFAGRGYNITSLTVGPTEDPSISRMTILVEGDDRILDQVKKQLNKLIETIKVTDLTGEEYVDRELALVKVKAAVNQRSEVFQIADVFRARIVDISHQIMTVEVTGTSKKIDAFVEMMQPFQIEEMARTGRIALGRG
jgi:acetolactate synthase-1/3 small subunit